MFRKAVLPTALAVAAITLTAAWVSPGASSDTVRSVAPSEDVAVEPGMAAARFVIAPTGNEARYRVNEVLAGFDLPNDAVGVTGKLSGGISVDDRGAIIPGESRIVVDVTTLKSDKDRRDGYVQ